jgi:hypothetical protein
VWWRGIVGKRHLKIGYSRLYTRNDLLVLR